MALLAGQQQDVCWSGYASSGTSCVVSWPGGCEVQWLTRVGLWDWTVAFIEAVGESEDL